MIRIQPFLQLFSWLHTLDSFCNFSTSSNSSWASSADIFLVFRNWQRVISHLQDISTWEPPLWIEPRAKVDRIPYSLLFANTSSEKLKRRCGEIACVLTRAVPLKYLHGSLLKIYSVNCVRVQHWPFYHPRKLFMPQRWIGFLFHWYLGHKCNSLVILRFLKHHENHAVRVKYKVLGLLNDPDSKQLIDLNKFTPIPERKINCFYQLCHFLGFKLTFLFLAISDWLPRSLQNVVRKVGK